MRELGIEAWQEGTRVKEDFLKAMKQAGELRNFDNTNNGVTVCSSNWWKYMYTKTTLKSPDKQ